MDSGSLDSHYVCGEEIRVGDRVACSEWRGVVKFVLATGSFSEGFDAREWAYLGRGFMVEYDKAGLVFSNEADEDVRLLERAKV